MMPSDRNLNGHGGDGGGDGGWGRWPRRLGRLARSRGWAGTREVSEVSSWLQPRTRALVNLLLSSPSTGGWSEGRKREKGGQNRQQTHRDADERFHKVYLEK